MNRIGRRSIVVGGVAAVTGAATRTSADTRPGSRPRHVDVDPFTLGVASGDPSWDSVVLWTRLAVDPLADDGRGGMGDGNIHVAWEMAEDERFAKVVRTGRSVARSDLAHAVHVEVRQLPPGTWFWYRFRVGSWISPTGRTRTSPHPNASPELLRMSVASCSRYENGFFTAYRALADDDPDLVLHLGDFIYEYGNPANPPRPNVGGHISTLEQYRQRYALYRTDPDLQAAHAVAPWLPIWDDHEIDNNWAAGVPENDGQTVEAFRARRIAATRAYWENMPFRRSVFPHEERIRLHRRVAWGRLATFHLLDGRSYRDDQGGGDPPDGCGDGFQTDCPAASDPTRSQLGFDQEAWLLDGFQGSRARWDFIGQQTFFAQRDADSGSSKRVSMDAWDGYAVGRQRVTEGWVNSPVRNAVVLTGDVHTSWANDLKLDYDDPDGVVVGTEYVATSISSAGDGFDQYPSHHDWFPWNPHLKFWNSLRGYVRMEVTPEELRVDFQNVPYVSRPGAEPFTKARFVTGDREPGANLVFQQPAPTSLASQSAPEDLGEYTIAMETENA